MEPYPTVPLRQFRVLDQGGGTLSHTGDTSETIVKTVTIPGNALGPNGLIKVSSIWSNNNNGNSKSFRWRLGGLAGDVAFVGANTTNISYNDPERTIANAGVANSQVGRNGGSAGAGASGSSVFTAAIDTTASVDLVFTVQLAVGTDNGALRAYCVEICHGP